MKTIFSIFSKKLIILSLALCTVAFLIVAEQCNAEDDNDKARKSLVVATLGEHIITLGYFESATRKQSPVLQKGMAEKKQRDNFLDKLLNMEVLAIEATRRGYADNQEVITVKKNQLASLMHKKLADNIEETEPTDEEMHVYYKEHSTNYNKPEKMRARHILIKDEAKAKELLSEILKKKPSQYEFRRMAKENSEDDSTKQRGGDLTFFSKLKDRIDGDPSIDAAILDAVFSLKKNGSIYASLVKTDKGFHIVMRTGYRKAMNLSFEDAKERLVHLVKRENNKNKIEDAINDLMKDFKVVLYEENLKNVVIDLSDGPPKKATKGIAPNSIKRNIKQAIVPPVQ